MIKTNADIGPCYEKIVKEFIVNIIVESNVEGNKEYKMVYDRGKCVNLSPLIINDYLGRSKVPFINNFMTKENEEEEVGSKEEEETKVRLK